MKQSTKRLHKSLEDEIDKINLSNFDIPLFGKIKIKFIIKILTFRSFFFKNIRLDIATIL